MVLLKTIGNLRARPRHERRSIARGIAMLVVAILFIAWVIFFFNKIRVNGIQVEPIEMPGKDAFNTPQITEAKMQIQNSFGGVKDSLQSIQNSAALQQDAATPAQTIY